MINNIFDLTQNIKDFIENLEYSMTEHQQTPLIDIKKLARKFKL